MLIVIEGPDRVGKSTLVDEIRRQILAMRRNAVSMHRGAPKPGDHPLDDYALPISVYTPGRNGTSIVADRLHLGDLTYGPIYRGECRQTAEMINYVNALIDSRGGVKVHLTADAALIKKRIADEGEENSYLKISDVDNIVETYKQICHVGWLDIDSTTWDGPARSQKIASKLLEFALEFETTMKPIYVADQDYIGPPNPRALFVGEDDSNSLFAGADATRRRSYGAFTPWEGSPAEYLIRAISEAGLSLSHDIGLTNLAGRELGLLHNLLGRPPVISLGELASSFVRGSGIPVTELIKHPAYELHHNPEDHESYAARIRRAVPAVNPTRKTAAQAFGG